MKNLKPYRWHIVALLSFILINSIGNYAMDQSKIGADIVQAIGGVGIIITLFISALKAVSKK